VSHHHHFYKPIRHTTATRRSIRVLYLYADQHHNGFTSSATSMAKPHSPGRTLRRCRNCTIGGGEDRGYKKPNIVAPTVGTFNLVITTGNSGRVAAARQIMRSIRLYNVAQSSPQDGSAFQQRCISKQTVSLQPLNQRRRDRFWLGERVSNDAHTIRNCLYREHTNKRHNRRRRRKAGC